MTYATYEKLIRYGEEIFEITNRLPACFVERTEHMPFQALYPNDRHLNIKFVFWTGEKISIGVDEDSGDILEELAYEVMKHYVRHYIFQKKTKTV